MSPKTKASVLSMIERERHRVAATITKEQEWELPEPNNGLARMFVIMLLIHVFVIGGIIIYDFVGGDSTPKSSLISNSITPARATSIAPSVPVAVPLISQAPLAAPKSITTTIAQPEAAPVPKALPYIAPAESPYSPVAVTKAALTDPAARSSDTQAGKAAPVSEITAPREPEKPKPVAEKAKPVADKPVADKPAAEIASKSPSQPKPVMTPSEARKALDGDSKATVAKKSDKEAADAPPARKKDKEVADVPSARKKDKEVADASPARKKDNADAPPAHKKDKEVADASPARKKDKEDADAPPTKKTAKASAPHSASKYTIVKGDTFYSLARRYKTTEDALMKANGIKNANALVLGKTITIPAAK